MPAPLITIGITCYREGEWLRECWESVLAQTDDRWEALLFMDGGHDEGTRAVFDSLEHSKLRKQAMPENMGPFPMRNRQFELTRTPYHFLLDADDQLVPETIALVLKTFQAEEADLVYGDFQFFAGSDELRRYPRELTWDSVLAVIPPGACGCRKGLWERLGGYAEELARGAADHDFLIGALETGARLRHCGAVSYRCRGQHSGRVSGSYRCELYRKRETIVRRHPVLFADRRRRRRYLARGYHLSAQACMEAGRRREAVRLARRALALGEWRSRTMWGYALPAPAYRAVQAGWRLAAPVRRLAGRPARARER